jgi:hypothetical protein
LKEFLMKPKRVQRSKDDLKRELAEQLALLRHSCETFDRGLEAVGKHIALSIRVLVHEHRQSKALLDQLGLRSIRFFDSAGPLNANNLLSEHNLVGLQAGSQGTKYIPLVTMGGGPFEMRRVPFVNWWNDVVIKDKDGRMFCRRKLVLNVADTDGGAHVDPELDEEYMALSRENSLGWVVTDGNITKALDGRPELACIRQIAHEVLSTIYQFAPEFSAHAQPVVP